MKKTLTLTLTLTPAQAEALDWYAQGCSGLYGEMDGESWGPLDGTREAAARRILVHEISIKLICVFVTLEERGVPEEAARVKDLWHNLLGLHAGRLVAL